MYGICLLTVIPMRKEKSDLSEMINQILFGESFKILKKNNNWSYVELLHDSYNGWICNKQYEPINEINKKSIVCNKMNCNIHLGEFNQPIVLGSLIPNKKSIQNKFKINFNCNLNNTINFNSHFVKICKKYLNSPYLWGGRTRYGIDCSGYTQIIYRMFKINLPRDAYQQEKLGIKTEFNDKKIGDLAFFEKDKKITHVGIILNNNKIIHASGKVKIDYIDNLGIYEKTNHIEYTHKLKSIKRFI